MKRTLRYVFGVVGAASLACVMSVRAQAQKDYVGKYDVYAGFADINAPALGLNQPGFHTQIGINPRRWYSVGFDFSIASGSEVLTTSELPAALQAQVNGAQQQYIAFGLLPPNYQLRVNTDARTETYALGPQLIYRKYSKVALFLRPSLGALHESATPHPSDPFQQVVVAELAPRGTKTDWTGFYGVGGGGDFRMTQHFGLRMQLDAVYNHPFNDILANGRWTYRASIGPSFHFGKNVTGRGK
ncbi:hypothetical protein [Granulicella tundricola]|uniref:Outer membrane protein beta-barrel domain-containing protein n=1 Tax=Granulicella tundricola (strain ATCC BAA-1859 / DSM 23138 / MP5ACTX9) TaxID=1198114 RepID=E8WZP5_GRATM|nr:hypothetical protein [Granulicella tundricola]ADW70019.1 hypothetical protein AciX9_2996 [Granulicella tundricola MP5ACTX9]